MSELQRDLTRGNVGRELIRFSIPFMLSNLLQAAYGLADMWIVGAYLGDEGIAGVNMGGQVTFFMTVAVIGMMVGGSVLIGQYMGAKRMDELKQTIGTMLTMLFICAVVITGLMLVLATPILRLLQTPESAFSHAREYLQVTVMGVVFIFLYNALSAIMRGMGDSKTPLIFVFIACVINVFLDWLMVGPLHWGTAGAAIATVVSQAISVAMCIIYLKRNGFVFEFKLSNFRINGEKLREIVKIGLPASFQNLIVNLSFLTVTAMVNTLNPVGTALATAAVGVVGKFNGFGILPSMAMSSAVSAMVAQNIGAGSQDRALETMKVGMRIAVVMGVAVFAFAQIFAYDILIWLKASPEAAALGVPYMRTFSFDYLFVSVLFCMNGLFMGAGHMKIMLFNSIISSVVLRASTSYLFGIYLGWGLFGTGLGGPVASAGVLLIAIWYLMSGKWRKSVTGIVTLDEGNI